MASVASVDSETFERLPKNVKPYRYQLKIQPFLDTFTFEGEEHINIKVLEKTKFLKLNCSEIDICDASLNITGDKAQGSNDARDGIAEIARVTEMSILELNNLPVAYDSKWETATIDLPVEIDQCSAVVSLKFKGTLNDKMRGFYRSVYRGPDGKDKVIATTQFEVSNATNKFCSVLRENCKQSRIAKTDNC
ncbi:unnamed protein product [Soboliphyme baturini]|uniref:Peptidase_M1_N domain-containing protein n=1 Tax=Soboliphyme baturini TaxID=241478 RepID=A0A183IXW7_9BILA|nr:unnamed protein product [Soboliphyme baturini]